MAKNKIGNNNLTRRIFQFKEWWKMHNLSISKIIEKIKNTADTIKSIYSEYCFIIIALFWILSIIIDNSNIVLYSFISLCVISLSIVFKYVEFIKEKFYITTDFSSTIKELDDLISDCIQEYTLMNSLQDPVYINDVLESKIREEVINLVIAKISKRLLKKLSIAYNSDIVHEVIAIRVYIIVMRLVVEINKTKDEEVTNTPTNNNQTSTFDLARYMSQYEE